MEHFGAKTFVSMVVGALIPIRSTVKRDRIGNNARRTGGNPPAGGTWPTFQPLDRYCRQNEPRFFS
jgi:hypothetical protein